MFYALRLHAIMMRTWRIDACWPCSVHVPETELAAATAAHAVGVYHCWYLSLPDTVLFMHLPYPERCHPRRLIATAKSRLTTRRASVVAAAISTTPTTTTTTTWSQNYEFAAHVWRTPFSRGARWLCNTLRQGDGCPDVTNDRNVRQERPARTNAIKSVSMFLSLVTTEVDGMRHCLCTYCLNACAQADECAEERSQTAEAHVDGTAADAEVASAADSLGALSLSDKSSGDARHAKRVSATCQAVAAPDPWLASMCEWVHFWYKAFACKFAALFPSCTRKDNFRKYATFLLFVSASNYLLFHAWWHVICCSCTFRPERSPLATFLREGRLTDWIALSFQCPPLHWISRDKAR